MEKVRASGVPRVFKRGACKHNQLCSVENFFQVSNFSTFVLNFWLSLIKRLHLYSLSDFSILPQKFSDLSKKKDLYLKRSLFGTCLWLLVLVISKMPHLPNTLLVSADICCKRQLIIIRKFCKLKLEFFCQKQTVRFKNLIIMKFM